jgi:hypothetical protein
MGWIVGGTAMTKMGNANAHAHAYDSKCHHFGHTAQMTSVIWAVQYVFCFFVCFLPRFYQFTN